MSLTGLSAASSGTLAVFHLAGKVSRSRAMEYCPNRIGEFSASQPAVFIAQLPLFTLLVKSARRPSPPVFPRQTARRQPKVSFARERPQASTASRPPAADKPEIRSTGRIKPHRSRIFSSVNPRKPAGRTSSPVHSARPVRRLSSSGVTSTTSNFFALMSSAVKTDPSASRPSTKSVRRSPQASGNTATRFKSPGNWGAAIKILSGLYGELNVASVKPDVSHPANNTAATTSNRLQAALKIQFAQRFSNFAALLAGVGRFILERPVADLFGQVGQFLVALRLGLFHRLKF
jgi:hypothetical protein